MSLRPLQGLVYAAVPVAYTWFVFVGGSAHADPGGLQINDKLAHAIVFFGLALVCGPFAAHTLVRWTRAARFGRLGLVCAAYSIAVGGALELWQGRLPHRTADVWDWVADSVGAFLAALVLRWCLAWFMRWRSHSRA
jgi:VanZ family protein